MRKKIITLLLTLTIGATSWSFAAQNPCEKGMMNGMDKNACQEHMKKNMKDKSDMMNKKADDAKKDAQKKKDDAKDMKNDAQKKKDEANQKMKNHKY